MEPVVIQPEDGHGVTVSAILVQHAPVFPALGYRFDTPHGSVVFSGDTGACENVVRLARGADVLIHDAYYPAAVKRAVSKVPNATRLEASIVSHHTTAEDAGRVASAAKVKLLVLSHLVPPDDPEVSDQMWIDAARRHFKGSVVVGKDLMEI